MPTKLNRKKWVKATRSSNTNGCVEGLLVGDDVAVRDSKLGDRSPVLVFSRPAWTALVDEVRSGRLDC